MDMEAMDVFDSEGASGRDSIPLVYLWSGLGALVFLATITWVCLTLPMLCGLPWCGCPSPLRGDSDDLLVQQIDRLALQVSTASAMSPIDCRRELERLKSECAPKLALASMFKTFSAAFGSVMHIFSDVCNVFTFFNKGWISHAVLLGLTVSSAIRNHFRITRGAPTVVLREVRLTLERGLFTEKLHALVRADKGVLVMPALLLKVYGLPFAADSVLSGLIAAGSIMGSMFGVTSYIFKEYDLGISSAYADGALYGEDPIELEMAAMQ